MSDWLDLSGRGTCFRKGDVDAVGGLVLLAWEGEYFWKWSVARVGAAGWTQERSGMARAGEAFAKLCAEEAARSVLGLTQRTLFDGPDGPERGAE